MFNQQSKQQIKLHLLDYITSVTTPSKDKYHYVCPVCGSGTGKNGTGALSYNPETNMYKCFVCDSHGDIFNLYADVNHLNCKSDYKEIFSALDQIYGNVPVKIHPDNTDHTSTATKEKDYTRFFHCSRARMETLKIDYLTNRGISSYTQKRFGCGYVEDFKYKDNGVDQITNAVIIPTSDHSFVWRSTISDVKQKRGTQCLFNALDLNHDICFVVEGEIDCMSIVDLGFPCCALGSTSNYGLLFKQDIRATLILTMDNDNAGRDATSKLEQMCKQHGVNYVVPSAMLLYDHHKDANAALIADRSEFTARLHKAVGLAEKQRLSAPNKKKKAEASAGTSSSDLEGEPNKKKKPPLEGYEQFAEYVVSCGYSIRYNQITHCIEFDGFDRAESREHLPEIVPQMLVDGLKKIYSGVGINAVTNYITHHATRNRYNPVLDLIKSVKWDGKNHLEELFKLLGLGDCSGEETVYSRIFLQRWLMQCICGLYNTIDDPYSLDLVLVLQGAQGVGKTRLLEHLALKPAYFGEGICLDPHNKDAIMQSTSKWIVELGELGSTMRRDMDSVKAFLTMSTDDYRAPYGKSFLHYPRITSFAGTVNDERFLVDETGNRRFLTIRLPEGFAISYDRIKSLDALQLWAQVHYMVDQSHNLSGCFRLSEDERAHLDKRNSKALKPLRGEEDLLDTLYAQLNPGEGYITEIKEMTVTEYLHQTGLVGSIDVRTAGKILQREGYASIKCAHGVRKMQLPLRKYTNQVLK